MPEKPKLKIDWATHEAAKYACEHWHYSKCMPVGKLVKFGVWENDRFIGCIIYSRSARFFGHKYGLKQNQVAELSRVALKSHVHEVTKMIAFTVQKIKKEYSNIVLLVSYADMSQGHEGIIYKAGNWILDGEIIKDEYSLNGKSIHPRTVFSLYGTRSIPILKKRGVDVERNPGKGKKRFIMKLHERAKQAMAGSTSTATG